MGNPLIAFLDEPTTGVDPVSRRCLWNAIHMVRNSGSSLVLTSHSMEECEALCNRLIIMVHGQLTCLGSPIYLKQKYGDGYIVQFKLKLAKNESFNQMLQKLDFAIKKYFTNCYQDAKHNNSVTYKLLSNIKLSEIFGKIEKLKTILMDIIEDYSISQTSLEQIFLSFVRNFNQNGTCQM